MVHWWPILKCSKPSFFCCVFNGKFQSVQDGWRIILQQIINLFTIPIFLNVNLLFPRRLCKVLIVIMPNLSSPPSIRMLTLSLGNFGISRIFIDPCLKTSILSLNLLNSILLFSSLTAWLSKFSKLLFFALRST